MTHTPRIRILVASAGQARWIERSHESDELVTLGELKPTGAHHRHGPAHVSFESAAGGMRHGVDDRGDAKRKRDSFAQQIAEALNHQAAKHEYDRLGLIAPPRLLKAIREHLSHEAQSRVHFELAKDLSKQSNHNLRAWLHNPEFA